MIMANLADLCNDRNKITWKMSDDLKAFCEKYQITPDQIEISYNHAGVWIKVKV